MNINYPAWVVACSAILVVSCGHEDNNIYHETVLRYDNICFWGDREFEGMTTEPGPLPGNIDLLLADGKRIHIASITRDGMAEMFGEPKLFLDDPGDKREHFGDLRCTIAFLNGNLDFIEVYDNVKVVKLPENEAISFPTTRQEIERVFGKPTAVERKGHKGRGP